MADQHRPDDPRFTGPHRPEFAEDDFEEDAFDRPAPASGSAPLRTPFAAPPSGFVDSGNASQQVAPGPLTDGSHNGQPAPGAPASAPGSYDPPQGRKPIEFAPVPSPWQRRGPFWKRRRKEHDDNEVQPPRVLEISDGQATEPVDDTDDRAQGPVAKAPASPAQRSSGSPDSSFPAGGEVAPGGIDAGQNGGPALPVAPETAPHLSADSPQPLLPSPGQVSTPAAPTDPQLVTPETAALTMGSLQQPHEPAAPLTAQPAAHHASLRQHIEAAPGQLLGTPAESTAAIPLPAAPTPAAPPLASSAAPSQAAPSQAAPSQAAPSQAAPSQAARPTDDRVAALDDPSVSTAVADTGASLRTGAEPVAPASGDHSPTTPLIWGGTTSPAVARPSGTDQATGLDGPGAPTSPAPGSTLPGGAATVAAPPAAAPPAAASSAGLDTAEAGEVPGTTPDAEIDPRLEHTPSTPEATAAAFGLGTAKRAIIVTLIGLILAALLNAQSIADTANRQPYGWRHDYATAVADPLLDVSETLKLTQPRIWIDDLLNRENDPNRAFREDGGVTIDQNEISKQDDTNTAAGATTTTVLNTTTTLPTFRTVVPGDPLRTWVGGDSLAYEIGIGLDRTNTPAWMNITLDSRHSTGLTRPDVFDWVSYLTFQVNSLQSEAIVFTAGINDRQPILVNGQPAQWNTPEWRAGYAARIQMLVDSTRAPGRHFYWVGQPAERRQNYTENIEVVNEIARQVAEADPDMTYLDGWAFFTPDGEFVSDRPNAAGVEQTVRQGDGVHLTFAGGEQFAAVVRDDILLRWKVDMPAFAPTTTAVVTPPSPTTTAPDGVIIINPGVTTTTQSVP